ncbi:MAG TPA: type II toxin-antitoxin system VapC family toxin [Acetobacteraceae bacterium]
MTLVVDASVAFKWFVAEAQSEAAEVLLTAGTTLLAPDLIFPEVCNVACLKVSRGEITADQAASIVDGLPELLDEVVPTRDLAARAFEIAGAVSHPAYDCFYLALAERRGVRLVTADRRLMSRMAGTRWAPLLAGLGDAEAM